MRHANILSFAVLLLVPFPKQPNSHSASPESIRPTMILWNTGLVETITPAMLGSRKVWRITHYTQDPTSSNVSDYDLYDLDRATLAPLRSVMNTDERHLELIFDEREVTLHKVEGLDNTVEKIPLSTTVQPEGPGLDVFVAVLPLAQRYKTQYSIVDRWGGHGSTRVKMITLSVTKQTTGNTALGKQDVYEILIEPSDNSFQIREDVLAQRPHFPLRVEYTRDGKTYPASEVTELVSQR